MDISLSFKLKNYFILTRDEAKRHSAFFGTRKLDFKTNFTQMKVSADLSHKYFLF